MTPKQLILSILEKMKPYRDMADGLIAFMQSEYADAGAMQSITVFLKEKVSKIKQNKQLIRQKGALSAIQDKEQQEKEQELDEIDDLLATIE